VTPGLTMARALLLLSSHACRRATTVRAARSRNCRVLGPALHGASARALGWIGARRAALIVPQCCDELGKDRRVGFIVICSASAGRKRTVSQRSPLAGITHVRTHESGQNMGGCTHLKYMSPAIAAKMDESTVILRVTKPSPDN